MDDAAYALALGERFDARLLRFGHDGLDAVAEIHDDLAAFEPFDEAVDQLAQAADVLFVNVVPLGLADFLQDDLLRGLRSDAPQVFHRARQFEHVADLRAFADFQVGLFDGHFLRRVGDLFDDRLDRVQLDRPGLLVVPRVQVFAGFKMLARSGHHGVFDRADDDLGVDLLLFTENFYVLGN